MKRCDLRTLGVWVLLGCGSAQVAAAVDTTGLETIEVVATRIAEPRDGGFAALRRQLATVPGGTNLVDLRAALRLSTLSDALAAEPGLVVQEFFGGLDQPRLTVRGSGIQGNPVARGVLLRQDHQRLNEADGSFIVGLLNLRDTDAIVVHRGANSRVPGSFTLGGDIDFVTRTDGAPGTLLQFGTGGFGHASALLVHAGSLGAMRYRASVVDERSDGFRHHSAAERRHYALRASMPFTDAIDTEVHLTHADFGFELPFGLPRERAENDPRSVIGEGASPIDSLLDITARDPRRAVRQTRLANTTRIATTSGMHTVGLHLQRTDDAFVDPFTHAVTHANTGGLQWTFDGRHGDRVAWQIGAAIDRSDMPRRLYGNGPSDGKRTGAAFADLDLDADNRSVSLLADVALVPRLSLNAQLHWGMADREALNRADAARFDGDWQRWLPKAGLVYRSADGAGRWFLNVSESSEMPTFWELVGVDIHPLLTWTSRARLEQLHPQDAVTVEFGTEQRITPALGVTATWYRSRIDDELISTESQFGVIARTSNYDAPTMHQGIELGLRGTYALAGGALEYRASWTWSDFRFDGGVFDGNRIAGVPRNLLGAELMWRRGRFAAGPNLRWVADDDPVDHANSLRRDAYALWGLRGEYRPHERLRLYASADNLSDERYVSAFVVAGRSSAELPVFLPGNGRSAQIGFSLEL